MESLNLRRSPAFTLVEVLLAMATGSMLLVVLVQLFGGTLTAFQSHDRRLGGTIEARAALHQLSTDLASYCELPKAQFSSATGGTTTGEISVAEETPGLVYVEGGASTDSDRIAFLRRVRPASPVVEGAEIADEGNLVLVAYAVGFTVDSLGRGTPKLFRRQFTISETYERVLASCQTGAALIMESDWDSITTGRDGAEPVAFYVVQFKARPLMAEMADPDGDGESSMVGLREPLDSELGTGFRPAALDLLLRVGHRSLAARLDTPSEWRGSGKEPGMILGRPPTVDDYSDDPEVETRKQRISLLRL
ncbi:MAG: PulJ/GspJ family protein [Verrucomicrobiaceae bacterium]|jgi:hypothetical protein